MVVNLVAAYNKLPDAQKKYDFIRKGVCRELREYNTSDSQALRNQLIKAIESGAKDSEIKALLTKTEEFFSTRIKSKSPEQIAQEILLHSQDKYTGNSTKLEVKKESSGFLSFSWAEDAINWVGDAANTVGQVFVSVSIATGGALSTVVLALGSAIGAAWDALVGVGAGVKGLEESLQTKEQLMNDLKAVNKELEAEKDAGKRADLEGQKAQIDKDLSKIGGKIDAQITELNGKIDATVEKLKATGNPQAIALANELNKADTIGKLRQVLGKIKKTKVEGKITGKIVFDLAEGVTFAKFKIVLSYEKKSMENEQTLIESKRVMDDPKSSPEEIKEAQAKANQARESEKAISKDSIQIPKSNQETRALVADQPAANRQVIENNLAQIDVHVTRLAADIVRMNKEYNIGIDAKTLAALIEIKNSGTLFLAPIAEKTAPEEVAAATKYSGISYADARMIIQHREEERDAARKERGEMLAERTRLATRMEEEKNAQKKVALQKALKKLDKEIAEKNKHIKKIDAEIMGVLVGIHKAEEDGSIKAITEEDKLSSLEFKKLYARYYKEKAA